MIFELFFILMITFAGCFIATVSGFGISTLMVPLMVLFFPFAETLLFVGIIHWFNDLWVLSFYGREVNKKLFIFFGIPGIIATLLGASLITVESEHLFLRVLGIFLLIYALFIFIKPTFKLKKKSFTAVVGGFLSGFFAGIFGMGGAISSLFLSAYDLPKGSYLATGDAIAMIIDTFRIGYYYVIAGTNFDASLWIILVGALPVSFLGSYLGKMVVNKIPQQKFRIAVVIFLCVLGAKLIIYPH